MPISKFRAWTNSENVWKIRRRFYKMFFPKIICPNWYLTKYTTKHSLSKELPFRFIFWSSPFSKVKIVAKWWKFWRYFTFISQNQWTAFNQTWHNIFLSEGGSNMFKLWRLMHFLEVTPLPGKIIQYGKWSDSAKESIVERRRLHIM